MKEVYFLAFPTESLSNHHKMVRLEGEPYLRFSFELLLKQGNISKEHFFHPDEGWFFYVKTERSAMYLIKQ